MKNKPFHRTFACSGQLADHPAYRLGAWVDFYNLAGEKFYGQIKKLDPETGRVEIVSKGRLHHLELV